MGITTSHEKFLHELGDIYDAEHRFLKGQQEMLQAATDVQLQDMIQAHIQQSEHQVKNLAQVFQLLGQEAKGIKCDAAHGLVAEAQKTLREVEVDALRDCAIVGAATKVEHYEMASYRTLIIGAEAMGQQEIVSLLRENLQQEVQTAHHLEQSAPQLLERALQEEGTAKQGGGVGIESQHTTAPS